MSCAENIHGLVYTGDGARCFPYTTSFRPSESPGSWVLLSPRGTEEDTDTRASVTQPGGAERPGGWQFQAERARTLVGAGLQGRSQCGEGGLLGRTFLCGDVGWGGKAAFLLCGLPWPPPPTCLSLPLLLGLSMIRGILIANVSGGLTWHRQLL